MPGVEFQKSVQPFPWFRPLRFPDLLSVKFYMESILMSCETCFCLCQLANGKHLFRSLLLNSCRFGDFLKRKPLPSRSTISGKQMETSNEKGAGSSSFRGSFWNRPTSDAFPRLTSSAHHCFHIGDNNCFDSVSGTEYFVLFHEQSIFGIDSRI